MSTIELTYIEFYGLIVCSLGLVILTTIMFIHILQLLSKSKKSSNLNPESKEEKENDDDKISTI